MRERPAVESLANFAQELAFETELEQLRRCRSVGGTAGAVRAREHEDVTFGIDCHARDLAEIRPRWQLEKVRDGIERNIGDALLRERRRRQQHEQYEQPGSHLNPPRSA